MSRGWVNASACRLQVSLSCAVLCQIVYVQYFMFNRRLNIIDASHHCENLFHTACNAVQYEIGSATRQMICGSGSIVKLVPPSTSLLALFVEYSGKWPQLSVEHIVVGKNNTKRLHNMSHLLYLIYCLTILCMKYIYIHIYPIINLIKLTFEQQFWNECKVLASSPGLDHALLPCHYTYLTSHITM